jgi:hypothetical protein
MSFHMNFSSEHDYLMHKLAHALYGIRRSRLGHYLSFMNIYSIVTICFLEELL